MHKEKHLSIYRKRILLVGSSHTSLAFHYIKKILDGKASVSKLPEHAGNTEEMLVSLPSWPLEGKDIVYVYAGHRDLMLNEKGDPVVSPQKFKDNINKIIDIIVSRCTAKIVCSNIPPVSKTLLKFDSRRNERIFLFNRILEETAYKAGIGFHNFSEFTLSHKSGIEKYSDGLHFTRKFYYEYAENLADFFIKI